MTFLANRVEWACFAMPNNVTALSSFGVAVRHVSEKEPEKAGAHENCEEQELDGGGPFVLSLASFGG